MTRRWWVPVAVYGAAFVLLVVATWLAFQGNTKSSLKFVWSSIGLSVTAAAAAVTSVLLPRR